MPAYHVPYNDKAGSHTTTKWANTPQDAKDLVKKMRAGWVMFTTVGEPVLMDPQPFDFRETATKTEPKQTTQKPTSLFPG